MTELQLRRAISEKYQKIKITLSFFPYAQLTDTRVRFGVKKKSCAEKEKIVWKEQVE